MRRLSSTVVVVAGERAEAVVSGLGELNNVRALPRGGRSPAEMTEAVERSVASYVVHDAGAMPVTRRHWWPDDLTGWLRALPKVVPDQAGLTA